MTALRRLWPVGVLVALALSASVVGLSNDFTYDDLYIIVQNGRIHHLHHWWRVFVDSYWPPEFGAEGYRPITMLLFAVQWVIGGGTPRIAL